MEIKLNPNGWHRRLQCWVFLDPPMFQNFCPYFWLTNFCILFVFIIPIVPLVKLVVLVCHGISTGFERMGDYIDNVICKPMFENSALRMNTEQILQSWMFNEEYFLDYASELNREQWDENRFWREHVYSEERRKLNYKKREVMARKFEAWKNKNPNWEQLLAEYRAKKVASREKWLADLQEQQAKMYRERQQEERRKELAKIQRQKMFTWIAKNTKWMIYPILTAVALFVLYWVVVFLTWIWHFTMDHFYPENIIPTLKVIGRILLFAGGVVGLIFIGVTISKKTSCSSVCFCDTWLYRFLLKPLLTYVLRPIGRFFLWLSPIVGDGIESAWNTIMIFKSNYCPGIVWEKKEKSTN